MRNTAVISSCYVGIGDVLCLTPSIQQALKSYDLVYVATPVGGLLRDCERIITLDPEIYGDLVNANWQVPHLSQIVDETRLMYPDVFKRVSLVEIAESQPLHLMGNGEGCARGNYYMEEMILGINSEMKESESPYDILMSEPSSAAKTVVLDFFAAHGIDVDRAVLFYYPSGCVAERGIVRNLPTRAVRDDTWSYVKNVLTEAGYHLFSVDNIGSHDNGSRECYYEDVPVLNTSGILGLEASLHAIMVSRGVALQNSCRLLPMAQKAKKHILMGIQGGISLDNHCYPKVKGYTIHKLEPDVIHWCFLTECPACHHNKIPESKVQSVTKSFLEAIRSDDGSSMP